MPSYRLQELFHDLREGIPESTINDLEFGPTGEERPLATTSRTVLRTSNYSSWDDLAADIPFFCRHDLELVHDDAGVSGEFTVPTILGQSRAPDGSNNVYQLKGDDATPSNWPIEGVLFQGLLLKRFAVHDVEITGVHADADTGGIQNDGPGNLVVHQVNLTNAEGVSNATALVAYGGGIDVKGPVDIGNLNFAMLAKVKNHGSFTDSATDNNNDITGTPDRWIVSNQDAASCLLDQRTTITSNIERSAWYSNNRGGAYVYDGSTGGGYSPTIHQMGLMQLAGPTASDLDRREVAWDNTNDRLVVRDDDGNAYYISTDGTI